MVEIVIAVVGKPSVGKSTFFNAVNDTKTAKTGNFPFTTIEPNTGVSYYRIPCPCKKYTQQNLKASTCNPRYGRCEEGTRFLPIKLLDIAGLVPNASKGEGLGNKFLDDLRHAQVLIHILDVSGTTNAKGEQTEGYDPINDANWLEQEIHEWVFNNLWEKWDNIVRKHVAKKGNLLETLQSQFSGYGCNSRHISMIIDKLPLHMKDSTSSNSSTLPQLAKWTESDLHSLVNIFMEVRFPTILLLNKADVRSSNTDTNIQNILEKYHSSRCFVSSTAAECFLKLAREKNLISYKTGDIIFQTIDDVKDDIEFRRLRGENITEDEEKMIMANSSCTIIKDEKVSRRLNRIKNMILYRYGGTGVWNAIQTAVEILNPVVIFPVESFGGIISQSNLTETSTAPSNMSQLKEKDKEEDSTDHMDNMLGELHVSGKSEDKGNLANISPNNVEKRIVPSEGTEEQGDESSSSSRSSLIQRQRPLFEDAVILKSGATVHDSFQTCQGSAANLMYAEILKEGNIRQRIGKDYVLSGYDNIIKFAFSKSPVVSSSVSSTNP